MRAVVIGGGISGLTCAFRLLQSEVDVLLFEQSDRTGGVIRSVRQDGFLFELGPQSFLSSPTLIDLVHTLGLSEQLLRAPVSAPRFIYYRGRLEKAPMSPGGLITTPLLSLSTKLRLFREPFGNTSPPERDESMAAFVRRKFGQDLLDNLIAPFISGVYAGDPEQLSLRSAFPLIFEWEKNHRSVLRGMMKSRRPKNQRRPGLCSFANGVETLTKTLASRLGNRLRTDSKVVEIRRYPTSGQSEYELVIEQTAGIERLRADALVIAAPAYVAAALVRELFATAADSLFRIPYAPVVVSLTGYDRQAIPSSTDGFGFLVPRKEGLRMLGTVWTSSLFPGRAPKGSVNMATFFGGVTDAEAIRLSDEEILHLTEKELSKVMGLDGSARVSRVHRYARAIPQYDLGHGDLLNRVSNGVREVPGLFLTGGYFSGPAIATCIEQANRVAASVRAYLARMD